MDKKAKKYAQILNKLIADKSAAELKEAISLFVEYLKDHQDLHLQQQIVDEFAKLYNKENNIVTVEVDVAEKLTEKIKKQTIEKMKTMLQAEIELEEKIDNNLLGGMIIRWQDNVIDSSVLTKINKLKNSLK